MAESAPILRSARPRAAGRWRVSAWLTDTGWYDKEKGAWHENTQWHRVVTFQPGLIGVLKDKAKKGVRVIVTGEKNYRNWRKDGETSDRQQAEIVVGSDGKINFIDRETAD